jgi:hypothetical protein
VRADARDARIDAAATARMVKDIVRDSAARMQALLS